MELMSSLLLCALVAMVRQALGQSLDQIDEKRRFNSTVFLRENAIKNKKVLLNINGPSLVNMINEVQTVFSDINCHLCVDCIERAIKAYKTHVYLTENRPSNKDFQNSLLTDHYKIDKYRVKRNTDNVRELVDLKEIKTGLKSKNKIHKSMTVTKYNIDGEIYALKIKGTNKQNNFNQENNTKIASTECRIYRVMKNFSCDSPEAESILANSKRKPKIERRHEKIRKQKSNNYLIATTSKITTMYRKRQVDNSQVPENVIPSIEELMF